MKKMYFLMWGVVFFFLTPSSSSAQNPFINTDAGIGQYGYLEKDAVTNHSLNTNGGNWRELAPRWFITTSEYVYFPGDKGGCNADGQTTGDFVPSNHPGWSEGNIAYVSVKARDCSSNWQPGGVNNGSVGYNERDFMIVDVDNTYSGTISSVVVNNPTGNQNLVGSFTISAGSQSLTLDRLWLRNTGTAEEGTDLPNAGISIYYEAITGSEIYDGTENSELLYGDYGGNNTTNNEFGHDDLNISIPSGGLRIYIVVNSLAATSTLGRTVRFQIINDGISFEEARNTNFRLMRMDVTETAAAAAVLPVHLTHFTGRAKAGYNELNWATANEENNEYFAIERSGDARSWEVLGRVAGQGDTERAQDYQFRDAAPLAGTTYYRLQQMDYDGRFEYFGPVAIRRDLVAGDVALFPNPAKEQLFVQLPQANTAGRLQLRNMLGQIQQEWVARPGSRQGLALDNIPAGIYLLQWLGGDSSAPELLFSSRVVVE